MCLSFITKYEKPFRYITFVLVPLLLLGLVLNYQFNVSIFKYSQIITGEFDQQQQKEKPFVYNVFFIETNRYPDKNVFDFKQLCAVESTALNNPNALINFYTLHKTAGLNKDLVAKYKNIKLIRTSAEVLLENTSFSEWWKLKKEFILQD